LQINLFSIPIWIGNIDTSKIILDTKELKPTFGSELNTSFDSGEGNRVTQDSIDYLNSVIIGQLNNFFQRNYVIDITNIWENHYNQDDFQENHIHANSDLSFIIYKKITEARTQFVNPSARLLDAFYSSCNIKKNILGQESFVPECRENQIVIFPSYLEHFVRKTNNAITIAGNLNITFE